MPPTLTPDSAPAPTTAQANALALQAARALLAEERDRAARALPSLDPDWRFLLALYEAELDGRALNPAQAAEAAAIPPEAVEPAADHFQSQDFLVRAPNGALRLTEEACEHMAVWVAALNPIPGFNPYRAAAGAPPPEPPPEPPGSRW
ncbi:MAG TPA: hypothetical protein VGC56_16910 [Allosphingosinicella sp.]